MKKIALIFALILTIPPLAYGEKGANTEEIVFIHYQDESVALQEVKTGKIDAYFWRIPLELVPALEDDPNIKLYESPGGRLSILLNPAPGNNTLNPFSIKEVRYAMNYLIDRELIVNEILKGSGAVSYSAFGPFDPDYMILVDIIESFGFRYNPNLADRMISNALEEHNAVKRDGKWYYNDEPITIKLFIRNDDPRRNSIGKLLASELEKLGFTIEEINGDLNKAFATVYGSDPASFEWHIYTEGWGSSAFERYDSSLAAQMYAPWFASMPGFQNEGFWNYQNDRLDDLTIKIFNGNYTSKEERDQLLREAVKLGVEESVRIFIASTLDTYIVNREMEGIVADFGAGITSRFTLINARSDDDELKIGMKQIYQGSWNPVGGFKDWYSTRVWLAIADPSIFRHPYTGDILPVRATWEVETAGPNGRLEVPKDAFIWNATSNEWVNVNTTAISKVTFDLKYGKWHHGVMMDKNDILYAIYFLYEWGSKENEDDPTYDDEYAATARQFINTLKGFRFLDDDTLEVYVDYWHFDNNYIADYASVWSSTPWEIYAAMEDVVINKKGAFSRSEASANNVNWLSLLIKDDATLIKEALIKFRDEKFTPRPLTNANAIERYTKAIEWIDTKGHAVISNGPFYLDSYNPDARTITIKAFRDDSYPFERDHWREFENVRLAKISSINVPLSINRGDMTNIEGSVEYDGDYNDVSIFYFLKNGNGDVVVRGDTKPDSNGNFTIELSPLHTSKLSEGSNELKVMSISNKALKPDIRSVSLIAVGEPIKIEEVVVDGNIFDIGLRGDLVKEIRVEKESKSLLLEVDVKGDALLEVILPRELIDAKEGSDDKPFVVTIDDNIVEVEEEVSSYTRTLKIPLTANSKEVRITGTQIVPEFGVIALLILTISISALLLARRLNLYF